MKEFAVKSWSSFHFSPHTLSSLPQRSLQFPAVFLVSDGLCELEHALGIYTTHHILLLAIVVCALLFSFSTVSYQCCRAVSIFLVITQYSVAWMYHNHLTCPLLMEICFHLSLAQVILQWTTISNLFLADDVLEMSPCSSGPFIAFYSDAYHSCDVSATF